MEVLYELFALVIICMIMGGFVIMGLYANHRKGMQKIERIFFEDPDEVKEVQHAYWYEETRKK